MKKVVCPACGLINLEKFVTFPHCAACGAQLSDALSQRVSIWKRPVSAPLWATILGLCCAGLGVLGILTARETRRIEEKQLLAYVQLPRRMTVGRQTWLRLSLDVRDADAVRSSGAAPFEEVRLRFPGSFFEDFTLVTISPPPDRTRIVGNGHYFHFNRVERDQSLGILLRPRRAGTQRMLLTLNARECLPLELRGLFEVGAAPAHNRGLPRRAAPEKETRRPKRKTETRDSRRVN